jgi:magnesium transporter
MEWNMTEARFYHVDENGSLTQMDSLENTLDAMKTGGYSWLDYYQPKKEDLALLVQLLGLHPLSIEDCVDENQIPKIDDYPHNTFLLFNAFSHY